MQFFSNTLLFQVIAKPTTDSLPICQGNGVSVSGFCDEMTNLLFLGGVEVRVFHKEYVLNVALHLLLIFFRGQMKSLDEG